MATTPSLLARSEQPNTAPAPRPRRRRPWLAALLSGLASLLAVGLVGGALYVGSVDRAMAEHLNRKSGLMPPADARPKKVATGPLNFLLIGTDKGAPDAQVPHSDTVMVLHLAADRQSAHLISFPADMKVQIPGHGNEQLKMAYARGGSRLTVKTLESVLDTRMDHVVIIDFNSFMRLIDELDGVTVDNAYASGDGGYTFPVGELNLSGAEALAYVREVDLPKGDVDRVNRQRAVMKAIFDEGLARNVANPQKFVRFATKLADNVTVDDGLAHSRLRKILLSLRLTEGDVELLEAPVSDTSPRDRTGAVDSDKLAELSDALRKDDLAAYER